ncbi:DoxX family protein [Actinospongicola halichondriae]|uniref:DoxX family protein n=1 Tax=Actinospongicola halichondriae TaxID=3236844 RepID=UPI003D5232C6
MHEEDREPEDQRRRRSRFALAAVMLGTGTLHFVVPRFYEQLIPDALPGGPRAWVYGSGVAELAAGALLVDRRTERLGAWATFAVFVGVWPGNIHDAIQHPPTDARGIGSLIRLPMQIPLFLWALRHTRPEAQAQTRDATS